jgi:hypothetical protein
MHNKKGVASLLFTVVLISIIAIILTVAYPSQAALLSNGQQAPLQGNSSLGTALGNLYNDIQGPQGNSSLGTALGNLYNDIQGPQGNSSLGTALGNLYNDIQGPQGNSSLGTALGNLYNDIQGPPSDPQWAIGAYSTSLGNSQETTTWSNMPSSLTFSNSADFAAIMVNCPFSASGTLVNNSITYQIQAIIFQVTDNYQQGAMDLPYTNVVIDASYNGYNYMFYWAALWGTSLGSGQITETVQYTTYQSHTGWWMIENGMYLMCWQSNGAYYFNTNYNPAAYGWKSPITSITQTGMGTVSAQAPINGSYINPSIALEVLETNANTFFTNNPNFAIDANALTSSFFPYAYSLQNYFCVGNNLPPTSAWGCGLNRQSSTSTLKYDQFGTSSGINSWMSSQYGVTSPSKNQTYQTNLPNLNTQYYVSIFFLGPGAGSTSPASGYYNAGQQVSISATANSGYSFTGWFGTGSGSYSGTSNPATITVNSQITEMASFKRTSDNTFYLQMVKTGLGSGTLTPSSGWFAVGSNVNITEVPGGGCTTFGGWTGLGSGSYTGMNNPDTITMNSCIQETGLISNFCLLSNQTGTGG